MSVILLFVTAYQVTDSLYHEWLGAGMLVLFIVHNLLNIKWYSGLFKGKYSAKRALWTLINVATLIAILLTGYSGIAMSRHLFTFLDISTGSVSARAIHLSASYWSFVLMSCHLGIHWGMTVTAIDKKAKKNAAFWWIMRVIAFAIAVYGAVRFYQQDIYSYMFLKNQFAFLDYEKAFVLVILDNAAMMAAFIYVIYYLMKGITVFSGKMESKIKIRNGFVNILTAVLVLVLTFVNIFSVKKDNDFSANSWNNVSTCWQTPQTCTTASTSEIATANQETASTVDNDISDGFIFIKGGIFQMGSPESENWRSADEVQHSVTVSDFYMSPYEVTGEEYEAVMDKNPSMFKGDNLPVESVSWIDAIKFCNAKSEIEGLEPVYTIDGDSISWNRNANGYRLPTEAEWEYACRSGTTTPFNTEISISAEESNYYGHYPYEIEENYFSQDDLTTKPGEYRQTTVDVTSFSPNTWGLYNMHGNVSEWVWDIYDEYDISVTNDPVGAPSGNRRVYRGGGWNDFAKNMRSAYRATMIQNQGSFNIGIRLARNAIGRNNDIITAEFQNNGTAGTGKVLIAYFSWGGNTKGVAEEIENQTDADIFEIILTEPYSDDYNTVLEQAQHDQNIQARPEIENHIDNIDDYDIILLGYPNWWASIPMPIASFLEEYDFSGKTIIPFCSHGGGRFGQSITAISKLAPNSAIGEGLSIHYSGGSEMPEDVSDWLSENGLK